MLPCIATSVDIKQSELLLGGIKSTSQVWKQLLTTITEVMEKTACARRKQGEGARAKGVAQHRRSLRWEANLWEDQHQLYLGGYPTEDNAAKAHDMMAIKCRGRGAVLNFDLSTYTCLLPLLSQVTKDTLCDFLRLYGSSKLRGEPPSLDDYCPRPAVLAVPTRAATQPVDAQQTGNAKQTVDAMLTRVAKLRGDAKQTPHAKQTGDAKQTPHVQQTIQHKQPGDAKQIGEVKQVLHVQQTGNAKQTGDAKQVPHVQQTSNAKQTGDAKQVPYVQQTSNAKQPGDAKLTPHVQQTGNAKQPGNAKLTPHVQQIGNAKQPGNAKLTPHVQQTGNAKQPGDVKLILHAQQTGNAKQTGHAKQIPHAQQTGNAKQTGDAKQTPHVQQTIETKQPGDVKQIGGSKQPPHAQQTIETKQPGDVKQISQAKQPPHAQQTGDSRQTGCGGQKGDTKQKGPHGSTSGVQNGAEGGHDRHVTLPARDAKASTAVQKAKPKQKRRLPSDVEEDSALPTRQSRRLRCRRTTDPSDQTRNTEQTWHYPSPSPREIVNGPALGNVQAKGRRQQPSNVYQRNTQVPCVYGLPCPQQPAMDPAHTYSSGYGLATTFNHIAALYKLHLAGQQQMLMPANAPGGFFTQSHLPYQLPHLAGPWPQPPLQLPQQHLPQQHEHQQHMTQQHMPQQHQPQQHMAQQHEPQQHVTQQHMPQQHQPQQHMAQQPQRHEAIQHVSQQHEAQLPPQYGTQLQLPQQHQRQQHMPHQHVHQLPQQQEPQQRVPQRKPSAPGTHLQGMQRSVMSGHDRLLELADQAVDELRANTACERCSRPLQVFGLQVTQKECNCDAYQSDKEDNSMHVDQQHDDHGFEADAYVYVVPQGHDNSMEQPRKPDQWGKEHDTRQEFDTSQASEDSDDTLYPVVVPDIPVYGYIWGKIGQQGGWFPIYQQP